MMTFDERRFGETRPDGSVREPEGSVLTGRSIEPGDARIQLPNSRYFVRVKASEWRRMSAEEKIAMREEWQRVVPESDPASIVHDNPTYEDMAMDDLKALAEHRGVDLTGRRGSKQSIANALRAADVAARFADNTDDAASAAESAEVTDGN